MIGLALFAEGFFASADLQKCFGDFARSRRPWPGIRSQPDNRVRRGFRQNGTLRESSRAVGSGCDTYARWPPETQRTDEFPKNAADCIVSRNCCIAGRLSSAWLISAGRKRLEQLRLGPWADGRARGPHFWKQSQKNELAEDASNHQGVGSIPLDSILGARGQISCRVFP